MKFLLLTGFTLSPNSRPWLFVDPIFVTISLLKFVPAEAAADFNHHSATGTTGGRFNRYEQTKTNKVFESYLNYVKDIASIKSRVDVVAGYSWQDWKTETPTFPDLAANKTDTVGKADPRGFTQNTLVSFYGRLNYSLMNRYLVTFTIRRDGSSRFSEDNRWGNFPSVALAWNAKEESFLKDNRIISALKFRFGWGITGQQDGIPDYGYQPNFFFMAMLLLNTSLEMATLLLHVRRLMMKT